MGKVDNEAIEFSYKIKHKLAFPLMANLNNLPPETVSLDLILYIHQSSYLWDDQTSILHQYQTFQSQYAAITFFGNTFRPFGSCHIQNRQQLIQAVISSGEGQWLAIVKSTLPAVPWPMRTEAFQQALVRNVPTPQICQWNDCMFVGFAPLEAGLPDPGVSCHVSGLSTSY